MPAIKKPQVIYFILLWLFAVRQVLLQMPVRRKQDVIKAVQELGPNLWAAPTDAVGLL